MFDYYLGSKDNTQKGNSLVLYNINILEEYILLMLLALTSKDFCLTQE